MPWHGILGHDEIAAGFRRALERGRLASTFLFAGPAGVGKRTFAIKLAQALLVLRAARGAARSVRAMPVVRASGRGNASGSGGGE